MEIWKDLVGILGERYEVSNLGNIRTKIFYDSWNRKRGGNILIKSLDKRGYERVRLCMNYNKSGGTIHRMVAKAFIENPNNLPQVNHKDGIKTNNNVSNLEWCNNSYNQKHAIDSGLKIHKKGILATSFKASILVYNLHNELIDELFGNEDMKNKGYDYRNVSAVVLGKRKTYKNLIFKRNEQV